MLIGMSCHDFGNQEPAEDTEIADFCELNFGVSFPLFQKSAVSGPYKNAVYEWLTDKSKNGWNTIEPGWNFYKYLINEEGDLVSVASSSVEPTELMSLT